MKLYIANCSRQNWTIQYRLDFNREGELDQRRQFQPARQQEIPAGRQVMVHSPDLHMSQVDEIVNQLQRYGMKGVADVPNMRTTVKKFDPKSMHPTPLIFNVDKPVPADTMRLVQDINARIHTGQGQERRARAAVATNEVIQQRVANEFANAGMAEQPTDKIGVAFEQIEQSELGEKPIAEGYRVDAAAPGPAPKGKGAKARRKG